MKLSFSKSPILALVVVAALAGGTALVAGYVDGPGQGTAVAADSKCADCPKAGTDACCEVSGVCEKGEECASSCGKGSCEEKAQAGCCPGMAQTSGYPIAIQQEQSKPSCETGGCPFSQ